MAVIIEQGTFDIPTTTLNALQLRIEQNINQYLSDIEQKEIIDDGKIKFLLKFDIYIDNIVTSVFITAFKVVYLNNIV